MKTLSKNSRIVASVTVTIASLMATVNAEADIYKWVDDQGNVHYGDAPKSQAQLLQRTSPRDINELEPSSSTTTDQSTASPATETPFSKGKTNATREERCKEFGTRLERYKNAGDMFINNPDGTRHKLASDERARLIQRTQSQTDEACAD